MAEYEYPVDSLTGLPYPVAPYETSNYPDTNHPAFHRDNPALQELSGLAVRFARVQGMDREEHKLLHHRYASVELPQSIDEKFEYCVWAALGDIPPYGVVFGRRSHWVEQLDSSQISILRGRDIRVDSGLMIGHFFAEYLNHQGLSFVDDAAMVKHLYTPFKTPKKDRGQWLVREAAESATAALQPKYRRLRRDGRVIVSPNVRLSDVVLSYLRKSHREDFLKKKRHQLSDRGITRLSIGTLQTGVNEVELAA
jgi:hypothetical protein